MDCVADWTDCCCDDCAEFKTWNRSFHAAVVDNDLTEVRAYLNMYESDWMKITLGLYKVVKSHCSIEMAKDLLRNGANATEIVENGWNCVHLASRKNSVQLIELFVEKGVSLNVPDQRGDLALDIALDYNNIEVGRTLVENAARAKGFGEGGYTDALRRAVGNEKSISFMELFLENGADPNFVLDSDTGCTLFQKTFSLQDDKVTALFLKHGADITHKNVLYLAAEWSSENVVHKILQLSAVVDVNQPNDQGLTLLYAAVERAENAEECLKLVNLLIRYGADLNVISSSSSEDRETPLSHAIASWSLNRQSIRVKAACGGGEQIFTLCVSGGEEIIDHLMKNGAKFLSEIERDLDKMTSALVNIEFDNDFYWIAKILMEKKGLLQDYCSLTDEEKEKFSKRLARIEEYRHILDTMSLTEISEDSAVSYYDVYAKRGYALMKCLQAEGVLENLALRSHKKEFRLLYERIENNVVRGLKLMEIYSAIQDATKLPPEIVFIILEYFTDIDLNRIVAIK